MRRPTPILTVLTVCVFASCAVATSAQGLSTRELEEQCPTLAERQECQQAITKREYEERTRREEQEGRSAAEAPGACAKGAPGGETDPWKAAYEAFCEPILVREAEEHVRAAEGATNADHAATEREYEALLRQQHEAEEARHAAKISKEAKEVLAEGSGVSCGLIDAESEREDEEVLARCRTLLAEKIATAWSRPVALGVYVHSREGRSTKLPGYTTLIIRSV